MPNHAYSDVENKCCKQRRRITFDPAFDNLVLDREVLAVAIIHRRDFYVGPPGSDDRPERLHTASTPSGDTDVSEGETCVVCAV